MRQQTQKVRVQSYSLTSMQESGWDLSDNAQDEKAFYAKFASQNIMNQLTAKQRRVVILLGEGMTRTEIAKGLLISLQEVHQMIARIRRRIEDKKVDKDHIESVRNLVWVFHYYTNCSPKALYDKWSHDDVLREYTRPSLGTLKKWVKGFSAE